MILHKKTAVFDVVLMEATLFTKEDRDRSLADSKRLEQAIGWSSSRLIAIDP